MHFVMYKYVHCRLDRLKSDVLQDKNHRSILAGNSTTIDNITVHCFEQCRRLIYCSENMNK